MYTFNERASRRIIGFTKRENALPKNANQFLHSIGLNLDYSADVAGLKHLCGKENSPNTNDIELLDDFVTTLFGNADWYNRQVIWEIWKQHFFLIFSIILLIGIPIFLAFYLPKFVGVGDGFDNLAAITGQTGAVLTSVIALQRTFSAWFGRRKIVGRRWRARSALIGLIHDIEHTYKYKFLEAEKPITALPGKMREDLRDAIKKAREIVEVERLEFFDNYALPEIDVGASIVSANAVATKIIGAFRAPLDAAASANRERLEKRLEVEKEYRRVEERVDFLQKKFDRMDRKISKHDGLEDGTLNAHAQEIFVRQVHEMEKLKDELEDARDQLLSLKVEKHLANVK